MSKNNSVKTSVQVWLRLVAVTVYRILLFLKQAKGRVLTLSVGHNLKVNSPYCLPRYIAYNISSGKLMLNQNIP